MTLKSAAHPSSPKYLIIGSNGQVGRALKALMTSKHLLDAVFLNRQSCDLEDDNSLAKVIAEINPQIIINASAYTKVDLAEKEAKLAFAINEKAVEVMARYVAQQDGGVLIHYSTDYVFDGQSNEPYQEQDKVNPLSVYGQSKLAGELAIQEEFKKTTSSARYFILRTSWVYGDGGNFIRTMLRLAAERDQLKVVADQVGAPTSARWLAEVAIQLAQSNAVSGIYHTVPDGEVSWHGLAMFAIEMAATLGEGIEVKSENILPIPATEYPLPAPRPYNSRLNNAKLKKALVSAGFTGQYPQWQEQVADYVSQIVQESLKS